MDGICVRDVSSTGEGTPAGPAPAQCGAGGQRACKGAELDGVTTSCLCGGVFCVLSDHAPHHEE